jgi:hypothetical protein
MPGGDGTGPSGMGPMTGRAAGYCAGYPVPGYMNPAPGYGAYGRGRGGGRGRRHWYHATGAPGWVRASYGYPAWGGCTPPRAPYPNTPVQDPAQEFDMLKQEADFLHEELNAIQERMESLKKSEKKEGGK